MLFTHPHTWTAKYEVIDRAKAQLMWLKFHRPKYGFGKDLGELREIIAKFAI